RHTPEEIEQRRELQVWSLMELFERFCIPDFLKLANLTLFDVRRLSKMTYKTQKHTVITHTSFNICLRPPPKGIHVMMTSTDSSEIKFGTHFQLKNSAKVSGKPSRKGVNKKGDLMIGTDFGFTIQAPDGSAIDRPYSHPLVDEGIMCETSDFYMVIHRILCALEFLAKCADLYRVIVLKRPLAGKTKTQAKGCTFCKSTEAPLKACGRCRNAFYCTSQCQNLDWKEKHKAQCRPVPKLSECSLDNAELVALKLFDKTSGAGLSGLQEMYENLVENEEDIPENSIWHNPAASAEITRLGLATFTHKLCATVIIMTLQTPNAETFNVPNKLFKFIKRSKTWKLGDDEESDDQVESDLCYAEVNQLSTSIDVLRNFWAEYGKAFTRDWSRLSVENRHKFIKPLFRVESTCDCCDKCINELSEVPVVQLNVVVFDEPYMEYEPKGIVGLRYGEHTFLGYFELFCEPRTMSQLSRMLLLGCRQAWAEDETYQSLPPRPHKLVSLIENKDGRLQYGTVIDVLSHQPKVNQIIDSLLQSGALCRTGEFTELFKSMRAIIRCLLKCADLYRAIPTTMTSAIANAELLDVKKIPYGFFPNVDHFKTWHLSFTTTSGSLCGELCYSDVEQLQNSIHVLTRFWNDHGEGFTQYWTKLSLFDRRTFVKPLFIRKACSCCEGTFERGDVNLGYTIADTPQRQYKPKTVTGLRLGEHTLLGLFKLFTKKQTLSQLSTMLIKGQRQSWNEMSNDIPHRN
ncbi:hypothetical protein HDV05_007234, partial [Chytridiales sp. JEL 0842]